MFRELMHRSRSGTKHETKKNKFPLRQLHKITYIKWVVFVVCRSNYMYSFSISKTFSRITLTSLGQDKHFHN